MQNLWCFIFLIFLFPLSLFAQSNYYKTDSSSFVGIKLSSGSDRYNAQYCSVKKDEEVIDYSPLEVKEYGFKNGRKYFARQIQLQDTAQRVFLERFVKGETDLYYYKGTGFVMYYIEKDSSGLNELPKSSFRAELDFLTKDCADFNNSVKLVSYNKKSLSKLFSRYEECEIKPFPHFKYGLFLGLEFAKLKHFPSASERYLSNLDYKYNGGLAVGLFLDQPILVSDVSMRLELMFSQQKYSYYVQTVNSAKDVFMHLATLKIPLLIRYTFHLQKISPFINAGGLYAFNFKNESEEFDTYFYDDIVLIGGYTKKKYISEEMAGFTIGGGMEYRLNYRNAIFFELRYSNLYTIGSEGSFDLSNIILSAGINF